MVAVLRTYIVIRVLFVLFTDIVNIHLGQKIEFNRNHFHAMIFYGFRRGLNKQQCSEQLALTFW